MSIFVLFSFLHFVQYHMKLGHDKAWLASIDIQKWISGYGISDDLSPGWRWTLLWWQFHAYPISSVDRLDVQPILLYHNKVVGWYIGFTLSVHLSGPPSARPACRVCSVAPTVLNGIISYLYILSSNFRRCVACKLVSKIWIWGNFLKFITLTLSCFDLLWRGLS